MLDLGYFELPGLEVRVVSLPRLAAVASEGTKDGISLGIPYNEYMRFALANRKMSIVLAFLLWLAAGISHFRGRIDVSVPGFLTSSRDKSFRSRIAIPGNCAADVFR